MALEVIGIIIQFLLLAFFIGLPLSKRRPIMIKNFVFALLILFVFSFTGLFSHSIFYIIGLLFAVVIYYLQAPWIIIGLTQEQLRESWAKALVMTRTSEEKISARLGTLGFLAITNFSGEDDKKTKLVKNVFRKLIENHSR